MGGARQTGPFCGYGKPVVVDDGTLCRTQTPRPGSVDSELRRPFVTVGEFLDHDYQTLKASLQSTYQGLGQGVRSNYEGARCLYQACQRAEELAPGAVLRETGYQLQSLLEGLIPGLLQMIIVVGATTFLGAAIGGIVGFFFGGVGAVPGAAVGGEIGLDVGLAVLTWLGVAFLAVSIAKGFGEMVAALQNGIDLAWRARNLQGAAEEKQVEQAAQELARTVGILVRLILQAIVAYLLKKAAVSATRGAMTTAGALRAEGAAAVSDATVAELVGKLRASKFGSGFADWVRSNWRNLVKDPKLQQAEPVQAVTPAEGSGAAASDSVPKRPSTSPKSRPASEPVDDPEPGPKKPVASDLEKSKFNGVEADRVRPGTIDKVAVIGRSMDQAVNPYADGLRGAGYDTETFQPSPAAQRQWSQLCQEYADKRIPVDKIPDTLSFQENQAWAQKLANQGYTVVDVDNPAGSKPSPFYEMEKQILFGGSGGGN
jgi:hypothetical protein